MAFLLHVTKMAARGKFTFPFFFFEGRRSNWQLVLHVSTFYILQRCFKHTAVYGDIEAYMLRHKVKLAYKTLKISKRSPHLKGNEWDNPPAWLGVKLLEARAKGMALSERGC